MASPSPRTWGGGGISYSHLAAPGAGVERAQLRLEAERQATAERLKDAPPPAVTRQQLRAQSRAVIKSVRHKTVRVRGQA